ncbi:plasmolipin-like [Periplaneta americana]|uniref:plasmolipin-like n=1 Tax=Periplaneta americana TaxID=6978 RepID=UPI0037E8B32F
MESNPQPTAESNPGQGQGNLTQIHLNFVYFRSIPGILKLLQLLIGVVCIACASSAWHPGIRWFLFVAAASFLVTLIWVFIYLLSIREAFKLPINWTLAELLITGTITVLYLIAFIVQLSVYSHYCPSYYKDPNIAAGVFGLFNTLAYGAGAFFLYAEWKGTREYN